MKVGSNSRFILRLKYLHLVNTMQSSSPYPCVCSSDSVNMPLYLQFHKPTISMTLCQVDGIKQNTRMLKTNFRMKSDDWVTLNHLSGWRGVRRLDDIESSVWMAFIR